MWPQENFLWKAFSTMLKQRTIKTPGFFCHTSFPKDPTMLSPKMTEIRRILLPTNNQSL